MKNKIENIKKPSRFWTNIKHYWWVYLLSLMCAVATFLLIGFTANV